jgi:hypothetical protein
MVDIAARMENGFIFTLGLKACDCIAAERRTLSNILSAEIIILKNGKTEAKAYIKPNTTLDHLHSIESLQSTLSLAIKARDVLPPSKMTTSNIACRHSNLGKVYALACQCCNERKGNQCSSALNKAGYCYHESSKRKEREREFIDTRRKNSFHAGITMSCLK